MNLHKLLVDQKKLDAEIERLNPTQEGENRIEKKVLALTVQLSKCADNWQGYKYWNTGNEPITFEWRGKCKECNGHGVDNENYSCGYCAGTGDGHFDPMLDGYVKSLRFILSIAFELKHFDINYVNEYAPQSSEQLTINELFSLTFKSISEIQGNQHQKTMGLYSTIWRFQKLGFALGFSDERIESAYTELIKLIQLIKESN